MTSIALNEDCMEVMKRYPDKYFDLAVVDPPYGGWGYANSTRFGGGNNWAEKYAKSDPDGREMGGSIRKKIVSWDYAPGEDYFKELFRVSKEQIIWGGNYFGLPPLIAASSYGAKQISRKASQWLWRSTHGAALTAMRK